MHLMNISSKIVMTFILLEIILSLEKSNITWVVSTSAVLNMTSISYMVFEQLALSLMPTKTN